MVRIKGCRPSCTVIYCSHKVPSAGGMEDASHPDPLGNQGIILLHCLLCLEDSYINALFLEVLHSGCRHLGRRKREEEVKEGAPPELPILLCVKSTQ